MSTGLEPSLKFEVLPTYDKGTLVVCDISDWKHLASEPTYIQITLPGSKSAVTHPYAKNKVTVYNSDSLQNGCSNDCADLPDGIYTIKIFVCEGDIFCYERKYLRTVHLELRVQRALMALNLECVPNSSCLNKILGIEFMIKGAKADMIFGNLKAAKRKYDLALDLMEDLEKCDCEKDCGNGHTTTAY